MSRPDIALWIVINKVYERIYIEMIQPEWSIFSTSVKRGWTTNIFLRN